MTDPFKGISKNYATLTEAEIKVGMMLDNLKSLHPDLKNGSIVFDTERRRAYCGVYLVSQAHFWIECYEGFSVRPISLSIENPSEDALAEILDVIKRK